MYIQLFLFYRTLEQEYACERNHSRQILLLEQIRSKKQELLNIVQNENAMASLEKRNLDTYLQFAKK